MDVFGCQQYILVKDLIKDLIKVTVQIIPAHFGKRAKRMAHVISYISRSVDNQFANIFTQNGKALDKGAEQSHHPKLLTLLKHAFALYILSH